MPVVGGPGGNLSGGIVVRYGGVTPSPAPRGYSGQSGPLAPNDAATGFEVFADNSAGNSEVLHAGGGLYVLRKIGGTAATLDASATTSAGITGDFVMMLQPSKVTAQVAGGVNTDPNTDAGFTSIDFACVYLKASDTWTFYQSGVGIAGGLTNLGSAFIWRTSGLLGMGRGANLAAAQASPDFTVANSATLYGDTSLYDFGDILNVQLYQVVLNHYSMTASSGAFALSGSNAGLLEGHRLVAGSGAFALSGSAAALPVQRRLTAASAAFVLTGKAAGLLAQRRLAAASGAFVLSGSSAGLFKGYRLAASSGAFVLTGKAAGLLAQRRIVASSGAFALNGSAAALAHGFRLSAASGAFALSGAAAGLLQGHRLSAGGGSFVLSGTAANMLKGRTMPAGAGNFALNGSAASFIASHYMAAAGASYALAGSNVVLSHSISLTAEPGVFTLYGYAATLTLAETTLFHNNAPAFASVGVFPLSSLANVTVATAPGASSLGSVAAVSAPTAFSIAAAPIAVELEE